MAPNEKRVSKIEVQQGRHDEQIKDLETRAEERRAANGEIFDKLDAINESINELRTSTAILWYKTGAWGMIGGAIPAIITLVILIMTGRL